MSDRSIRIHPVYVRRAQKWGIALTALLACAALWSVYRDARHLRVFVFDIGQGSATYIRTADHKDILIDGGPDDTILSRLGSVMPVYDREIDLMILTHPHADHVFGLISVLGRYRVNEIWLTGVAYETLTYTMFLEAVEKEGARVRYVTDQFAMRMGEVSISSLYPDRSLIGKTVENLNDSSIVTHVVFGDFSVLIPGDAEEDVEHGITARVPDVDVLIAGHHGSRTSSTEEFLEAARPAFVAISAGKRNKFGHPHQEALDRFTSIGAEHMNTAQDGSISIHSKGNGFWVTTLD